MYVCVYVCMSVCMCMHGGTISSNHNIDSADVSTSKVWKFPDVCVSGGPGSLQSTTAHATARVFRVRVTLM